jgi:hypothetical protein
MKYLSFAVFCLLNSFSTVEANQKHCPGNCPSSKSAKALKKTHKNHHHHKSYVQDEEVLNKPILSMAQSQDDDEPAKAPATT